MLGQQSSGLPQGRKAIIEQAGGVVLICACIWSLSIV